MGRVKVSILQISFDGSKKISVTGESKILKKLQNNIPGTNLNKAKNKLRFNRDEIIFLQVKKMLQKEQTEISSEVKAWAQAQAIDAKKIASLKTLDDVDIDIPYSNKLRKYQRVDVNAMKHMNRLILGNAPGTGKTLESIAYCDMKRASKVLIVCSKSLMGTWKAEINKWSTDPSYEIIPVDTTYKKKEKMNQNLAKEKRFNIINYEMLRDRTFKQLWSTKWDVVICDEAHRLKGRKTQLTEGASKLKYDSLILVTGTWINNNHHEVYQLLRLIDKDRFTSYWHFVDRFCETEDSFYSQTPDIVGPKNLKAYKYLMNKYLIQRRKRDVLTELPDIIHKTINIQMTPYQKKLYKQIQDDMMATLEDDEILLTPTTSAQYAKLRQICLSPAIVGGKESSNKVQTLLDIIENTEGQIIVFSWYKKFIKYLIELFGHKNIPCVSIHGDVSSEDRILAMERFTAPNSNIKVCLGTIKTMSEGLNLQTASSLIFTDKSYVPGDNEQAIARVDRMGQKNNPLIYHLVTENTIEEHIETILQEKQDLIDEASAIEEVIARLKG